MSFRPSGRKRHDVDMTDGSIIRHLIRFSIPLLAGNLFQQLYNMVDTWVVGNFVSNEAFSAVGTVGPIINTLIGFFMGLASGAGVVISQYYGAREYEKVSKAVHTAIVLTFVMGIAMTAIGIGMTPTMLRFMKTPEVVWPEAKAYLTVYFSGISGLMFYNMGAGILRAVGDSRRPFYFLVVAAVLNVVLDLVFVAGFDMGVAGVSLATVIAQTISALFCFRKLMKMRAIFDLNKQTVRLDQNVAMRIIRLGVPSGITQAIFSMAGMVVQTLTNSMGEMVIAANVIIMRVDGFAMMPNFSFGQAMSVYTGQNVGAAKYDRVGLGTKQGTIIAVSCSAVITCVLLFLNKFLFGIFTDTAELIDLAGRMMRLMAVGYLGVAITQSLGGVMRGAGDTVSPMWISIISTVFLRVPVAYVMAHFTASEAWPHGHPFSLSASLLISWVLGAVMSCVVFKKGKWKKTMMAFHEP